MSERASVQSPLIKYAEKIEKWFGKSSLNSYHGFASERCSIVSENLFFEATLCK